MDKYIKEIKVFTFPELNGEAKEKAKEWYLNDETLSWELTDSYERDLSCIFPNSDLKVQWSLSYCQGDGVNIYGSVNMEDIFSLPQNAPAYNWIDGYLTEKEIRTLRFYMSEYKNEVKIPVNRRYSYCMADSILSVDWINNDLITFVKDRLGHDQRYAIDPTKITNALGWYPETKFEDGIVKTIVWYLENQDWVEEVTSGDYQGYYEKMYGK